jgi:hypothetical protein
MHLIFNERTKLTASWINTLATALIAAGALAPTAAFFPRIVDPIGRRRRNGCGGARLFCAWHLPYIWLREQLLGDCANERPGNHGIRGASAGSKSSSLLSACLQSGSTCAPSAARRVDEFRRIARAADA